MSDIVGDRISYGINIDGLKNLDGMIRTMNQLDKLMGKVTKATAKTKSAINSMNKEMSGNHSSGLDRDKRGFESIADSAKKTGDQVDKTREKVSRFDSTMKRSGGSSYFKKQSRDLKNMGSNLQSFGRKAMFGTVSIGAAMAVSVKSAMTLQNRFKTITNLAVTGGEKSADATKNVTAMTKDATKYSDMYGVSQQKLADGYETLVRRGYTTDQALGSQKSYLQGAIASGDSYTDVVNNAASAIEQFGMKVNSVQGMAKASKTAVNQMAYSADLTAASFSSLGEALKYAGPDAHSAHQSLHTTVSTIGELSNYGIEGSQAGTSMRQIYQRLVNPPAKGKAPNAMAKLGLSYKDFRNSKNELLPIQDIFGKLDSKMKGMSRTDKGGIYAALFGANASSAAQALGESYKQVGKLDKRVKNAQNMNHGEGYVAQLSKKNMKTFQNQWNRIKQSLLNSGVEIANAWMPLLTRVAGGVANVLSKFQQLPKPIKTFVGSAVAIAALVGPLAMIAGSLMRMRAAMMGIAALGGKNGPSGGIFDAISSFTGFGGKNKPKHRTTRSSRHIPKKRRIPGSLITNGFDWSTAKKDARFVGGKIANTRVGSRVVRGGSFVKRNVSRGVSRVATGGKNIVSKGWNLAKSGGSAVKRGIGKIPGANRLGRLAKGGLKLGGRIASRIPILDIAMAGTNLIGMNKKNAGKKVGGTVGMLAGGALGSMFGPLGGMAGAVIGQTLGTSLGKTVQKSMPKKLQKSIGKAFKSIGKTFNNLLKPFKSVIKSISKVWNSATKGISKAWKQYVVKPLSGKNGGNFVKDLTTGFKRVLIPTMKVAGAAFKIFGAVVKTAIKIVAHIIEGLIKTISGVFSLISDLFHGRWKNIWKDAMQIFTGIFGTIGNVLGDILSSVWDGIKDFGGKVGGFMAHPIKTVKSWFGGGDDSKGKAHAAGGFIASGHTALVGEQGPELAYHPGKGYMRLLGKHGPEVTRVHSGERILNARDSRKVRSGGLGTGMVLPGYAKGTISLGVMAGVSSGTQKGKRGRGISLTKSSKSLNQFGRKSGKEWKKIHSDTNKTTKKLSQDTDKTFDKLKDNSLSTMKDMRKLMNKQAKNIVDDFYDVMQKLGPYMHKGMSGAVSSMNGGLRGINSVLSKFGGNGSTIPLVHYAKGTQGPISKRTLAVVNDAKTGPRQEAIVKPNGQFYMPQGNDVVTPLERGDEVLNGHEVRRAQAMGMLLHYAKGTGGLKRLIEKNNKAPKTAWANDFDGHVDGRGLNTFLARGLGATTQGATDHVGKPWNAVAWGLMNDAMNSGGAGGNWTHGPGAGWSHTDVFGSPRSGGVHDGNDFSASQGAIIRAVHGGKVIRAAGAPGGWGPVGYSIITKGDDGQYVMYQEFGHASDAKVGVGDIVKTGQAVARLGNSGLGTGPHVHIGVSRNYPFSNNGMSTAGWEDLVKMHGNSDGVGKQKSKFNAKSPLAKLAKGELAPQLAWIKKNLQDQDGLGSIGGGPGGNYESMIQKAAKEMHASIPGGKWMSYMLGMIKNESGGRAGITGINDGDGTGSAMGLLQYKKSTFDSYAVKGHHNILSAWDQLLAFFNNSNYKTDIGIGYNGKVGEWRGQASGPSGHRRFANGGWAQNGKVNVFGEVPGENEVAVNTHRPSADPLLMEAISDRAAKSPSSVFGQLKSFVKMQRELAKMRASQSDFSASMKQRSEGQKPNITIKPTIYYSPKITIKGGSDPEANGKKVTEALNESQRQFDSNFNDFLQRTMTGIA